MIRAQKLWLSMIFSAILPMSLGFALANIFSDWRWAHYPFHSMIESVGALSALTISTLIVLMVNKGHLPRYYILVACALIGMGILDGFHAVLHASDVFVWLHSVATLIGGLTFAAVWLPKTWLTDKRQQTLLISVTAIALLTSLLSITIPDMLPTMVIEGKFSILAKFLNIAGGIGFLMGTAFFVYINIGNRKVSDFEVSHTKDLVFANHCLLFGIAGLLFESSVIWDAGWWWWHILRLTAYLVVLVYFFNLFKQQQDQLSDNEIKLSNINKQLEDRVYERTKELEKANKTKSEFLSNMSHELRTPMNAILGFSQLLELDDNLQPEQQESVSEILKAGHHLMELINEVLDLAKIEEGKLVVNLEDVNISNIITDSVALLEPQAKQRNIQLINNVSTDINCIVQADRLRLKQVFLNLLSNAIKYNYEDGKVYIDMELIEKNKVRISIKDTGAGITEDKLNKLFVPFERLGYEGNVVEGAGIGLVLSKKMVELMNADIGVHSIPTQGSTFYIEFFCVNQKAI